MLTSKTSNSLTLSGRAPIPLGPERVFFSIDKITLVAYSPEVHPGNRGHDDLFAKGVAYSKRTGTRLRRLRDKRGRPGNYCLTWREQGLRFILLIGPGSYAMIVMGSATRRTRLMLTEAGVLGAHLPQIGHPQDNVIDPTFLTDGFDHDIAPMIRAEAALIALALPARYAQVLREVFGIKLHFQAKVSLVGVEIVWDLASTAPGRDLRDHSRAVSANFLNRARSGPGRRDAPPCYALVGDAPRFRFIAYEKLHAVEDHPGIIRFEFRFGKKAIRSLVGRQTLPADRQALDIVFARLASHAWPYLATITAERESPVVDLANADILRAVLGLRNPDQVINVLDLLASDGKVRVTKQNRSMVKRLERSGWLRPLLFRSPAYRKLTPGLDLSTWRRAGPEAMAMDYAIAHPISGGPQ